jgi:hypothetical protein
MNSSRSFRTQNLFPLLRSRRGLGATDARDMVFALWGLISDLDRVQTWVQVGYHQSCKALYEATARYVGETAGMATLIQHCASDPHVKGLVDLATWAPDWSIPSAGLAPMYSNQLANRIKLSTRPYYEWVNSHSLLAYIGYEVHVISSYSHPFPQPGMLHRNVIEGYEAPAKGLAKLYRDGGGVWWSGDSIGRHPHVNIRGGEAEHLTLVETLLEYWTTTLISGLSPALLEESDARMTAGPSNESLVLDEFEKSIGEWAQEQRKPEQSTKKIWVGSDSSGIQHLMWEYLLPSSASIPRVLAGRRLAFTQTGQIAVVPAQVQVGDVVVYAGGLDTSLLLRDESLPRLSSQESVEVHKAIQAKFTEKALLDPDDKELAGLVKVVTEMRFRPCKLVGTCYVDGEVGWVAGTSRNWSDYQMFAIH